MDFVAEEAAGEAAGEAALSRPRMNQGIGSPEYVTALLSQKTVSFMACIDGLDNGDFSISKTNALANCFTPMEQFFSWGKEQGWPQSSLRFLRAEELGTTCYKSALTLAKNVRDFEARVDDCQRQAPIFNGA